VIRHSFKPLPHNPTVKVNRRTAAIERYRVVTLMTFKERFSLRRP